MLAFAGSIWSRCEHDGTAINTGPSYLARTDPMGSNGPEIGGSLAHLLLRCAEGDRAAFRLLYDAQGPRLFGLALRLIRERSLAADVVHDAFCQVWQRAASFDPQRGSAEAWLTGLVRYRAIDLLRKRAHERVGVDRSDEADPAASPLERLVATAAGQALHRCLAVLDEDQRRVIALAFVDGLSYAKVSDLLRVPLGTVKSRIRRGLVALKACLEP